MPYVETGAIQAHLDVISKAVAPGAHAVLLLDRAGRHTTAPYAIHNVLTANGIQFITVGAGSSTVLIMTRAHLILSTTNR